MKNKTKLIRAVPALLAGLTLLLAVSCGNVGGSGESEDSGSGPMGDRGPEPNRHGPLRPRACP